MPVHRHVHDKIGSVYAYRRELDAWAHSRKSDDPDKPAGAGDRPAIDAPIAAGTERVSRGWLVGVAAAILVTAVAFVAWRIVDRRDGTLGFSPDGTLVTFWARKFQSTSPSEINIWAIPVLGGAPRPYLEGVAEFDWSPDASRVVYHTPGPGDPIFVRDGSGGTHA